MKLPLMAALTALLLGGCAHEGASRASGDASGTGGSGARQSATEAFASDQLSWDANESPRTQAMLRAHGMNPYGPLGDEAALTESSNAQASAEGGEFQCVDVSTLGTGGSGSDAPDTLAPSPVQASQNPGARLDITPPAWNRNKGIGVSPVAPSTGTPPIEGSGGAGQ